jgi:3'-5' exonuclease
MSPQKISHKLKDVVRRELGEELDKEQQKAEWSGELTDEMLPYAAKDAEVLPPVQEKLAAKVEDADLKRSWRQSTGRSRPWSGWPTPAFPSTQRVGRGTWSSSKKRRTGWGANSKR